MQNNNASTSPALRVIGYLVLAALTLAGLWFAADKFVSGPIHEGTTQFVTWGIWVSGYIFFLGLSAGSFLISTLIYVFGVKQLEEAGPAALVQAFGCLVLGGILIVLDAGHPERMYMVLLHFNPTSVMAYMGLFYNLYIAILLVEIYFAIRPQLVRKVNDGDRPGWLYRLLSLGSRRLDAESFRRDKKWLMILGILGIPAAIIVHGGVGTIFAVAKARPNWLGGLFPLLFIVSALTSGGALLTFLTAAFSRLPKPRKLALVRSLAQLTLTVLLIDALIVFADTLTTTYGGIPAQASTEHLVLTGPYRWIFWIGEVAVGLALPVLIILLPATNNRVGWLGFAGLCVAIGMLGARLTIVLPPQITPAFPDSLGAYNHLRYTYGYFPSTADVMVLVGVFALGVWMVVLAGKYLPLEEASLTSAQEGGALS
ncbi:MAG: NrfD/PsrC family molybdoenzyme membrane anchor subunit [Thermodesulfobacteriota bacterium]